MEEDFLVEMDYAGLTARLKRLSDAFVYSTKEFYKSVNLDIEPNWHMVFLILQKNEQMTVMEIAEALQLSHPAIVKLINKMKKRGYIKSEKDPEDFRKYQLSLSDKALKKLPEIETYWEAGNEAVAQIMNHNREILKQLEILEQNIAEADFKQRTEQILKTNKP